MADTELPERPEPPLTVGVSECLLGSEVRYNGSGAYAALPHAELDGLYRFRGTCPEVGIGLGVPREPIRLVRDRSGVRVVGIDGEDHTDALAAFGAARAAAPGDLAGFIFMHNSPSCGLHGVKVYQPNDDHAGLPVRNGRGIFADSLVRRLPCLPAEDALRLRDPALRVNFIMRTFAWAHWSRLQQTSLSASQLIEFHSRYKYLLMAHSIAHYQLAGRTLVDLSGGFESVRAQAEQYIEVLMSGLSRPASRGGHANVLAHLQGYLKHALDRPARQELARLIDAYRRGDEPLGAPLELLKMQVQQHGSDYLRYQAYFDPCPAGVDPRLRQRPAE